MRHGLHVAALSARIEFMLLLVRASRPKCRNPRNFAKASDAVKIIFQSFGEIWHAQTWIWHAATLKGVCRFIPTRPLVATSPSSCSMKSANESSEPKASTSTGTVIVVRNALAPKKARRASNCLGVQIRRKHLVGAGLMPCMPSPHSMPPHPPSVDLLARFATGSAS